VKRGQILRIFCALAHDMVQLVGKMARAGFFRRPHLRGLCRGARMSRQRRDSGCSVCLLGCSCPNNEWRWPRGAKKRNGSIHFFAMARARVRRNLYKCSAIRHDSELGLDSAYFEAWRGLLILRPGPIMDLPTFTNGPKPGIPYQTNTRPNARTISRSLVR
jgi:hypothetical protein